MGLTTDLDIMTMATILVELNISLFLSEKSYKEIRIFLT